MNDKDKILARIKKCLALSKSPKPHEAATQQYMQAKSRQLYPAKQSNHSNTRTNHTDGNAGYRDGKQTQLHHGINGQQKHRLTAQ